MKTLTALLVLAACSAVVADDAKVLDGAWTVTAAEYQKGSLSHFLNSTLVINDNVVVVMGRVRDFEKTDRDIQEVVCGWAITVDGDSVTLLKGKDEPAGKGIFRIEGDTLTLCLDFKGEKPASFATDAESHRQLLTLKRMP